MLSEELKSLLIQVITSWQVIAVTVVVFLYFLLVTYVARLYYHPRVTKRRVSPPSSKKIKQLAKAAPEVSDSEDLGLVEESS
ncbi:MAG: hypothetical protein LBG76_02905 [Treponema sp.]|jgi:hypothetical protein|nr:hypothetical protein [Treponema sp.]